MEEAPELYLRHRPALWKHVLGQEEAVTTLQQFLKEGRLPHFLLLTGPSGCGKTTTARILKGKLGCGDNDFYEMNCADVRGIDAVRDIRMKVPLSPTSGKSRIWLIDEGHGLTKDAQNAFLKLLEDTPRHVYFIMSTTDPLKLLATIRTRATEIKFNSISDSQLREIITHVAEKEGKEVPPVVADKIIECSGGSARFALVLLHRVITLEGEEAQLSAIVKPETEKVAFDVVRALLYTRLKDWKKLAAILKDIKEDAENVRRMVIACATTELLKGEKTAARANEVLAEFTGRPWDSGKAGHGQLVHACYNVVIGGE